MSNKITVNNFELLASYTYIRYRLYYHINLKTKKYRIYLFIL